MLIDETCLNGIILLISNDSSSLLSFVEDNKHFFHLLVIFDTDTNIQHR